MKSSFERKKFNSLTSHGFERSIILDSNFKVALDINCKVIYKWYFVTVKLLTL